MIPHWGILFSILQEIVEDFVFPASKIVLQSRKLTTGEFPTEQAMPVCSSPGAVNAAYDLLVALCTGCVPNLKSLAAMLIDMYYNGKNWYESGHEKTCLVPYANNKGADQPAHLRSLISIFVVRCLDSIVCFLVTWLICIWYVQVCFCELTDKLCPVWRSHWEVLCEESEHFKAWYYRFVTVVGWFCALATSCEKALFFLHIWCGYVDLHVKCSYMVCLCVCLRGAGELVGGGMLMQHFDVTLWLLGGFSLRTAFNLLAWWEMREIILNFCEIKIIIYN